MSASMYNSPYTYQTPLPRIKYPPFFSGCKISFKHVLDSKFLALAALLFLVAAVISFVCVISPFWFKLVLSPVQGTFGDEAVKRELTVNTGLFFMNENEMDNLLDLNSNNNQETVPKVLVLAQVLEVIGVCSLMACLVAALVLMMRRFASITANFVLAFFASLTGVCLVLVFVLALITAMSSDCDPYDAGDGCRYEDNLKWRVFPVYPQFYRVENVVTPLIKLNWTFYISIIAPILTIAGAALLWLESFMMYRQVSQIRYNQLRTSRSPHEGDVNPADHQKYVYQAPVQAGPMSYGMQPVMIQGGPYAPPTAPTPHFGVGFSDDPYERKQARQSSSSSPPPARRGRSSSPPPPRRRDSSPNSSEDSPPPTRFGRIGRGEGGRGSPPPSHRRRSPSPPSNRRRSPSPPSSRRRSPPPPARRGGGGPPSVNSSMSEGPYISREIDL